MPPAGAKVITWSASAKAVCLRSGPKFMGRWPMAVSHTPHDRMYRPTPTGPAISTAMVVTPTQFHRLANPESVRQSRHGGPARKLSQGELLTSRRGSGPPREDPDGVAHTIAPNVLDRLRARPPAARNACVGR